MTDERARRPGSAGASHGFSVRFDFPVYFTRDVWSPENRVFVDAVGRLEPDRRHRILVVVDDRVAAAHPGLDDRIDRYVAAHRRRLELAAAPARVPGGEAVKNEVTHPFRLLELMSDAGLDRQSIVAVIGGGAVLDMASFAAAIAHRSIRTVRLPTTVLSQADSGVAVKNGLNLFGKKNFIGTFVPPFAVVNDVRFLETLDRRDRVAGLSEAVKVAMLRDAAFYEFLEANATRLTAGDPDILMAAVRRSAELHLAHICGSGDPFELGSARPLDFGHWSAHKLESMTAHRLRHGEAVAIGMALDLCYAVRMDYLAPAAAERIMRLLEALGLRLWDPALAERDDRGRLAVLEGLREFREHLGGELCVTLIRSIGERFEVHEMDEAAVVQSIDMLASRARGTGAGRGALRYDVQ